MSERYYIVSSHESLRAVPTARRDTPMTEEDAQLIAEIVEDLGLTCFGALVEIATDGRWCVVWVDHGTGRVRSVTTVPPDLRRKLDILIAAEEVPIEREG